jgi:predicted RNA-binding protein with PUA-like domain
MSKRYWLIKSEPFKYSWDQFVADKITFWDGVRNYQARNNLRAMSKGDYAFFYHSNEGLEIIGIAQVVKEFYADPTADSDTWSVVDFKAIKELKKTVSLAQIKADPVLSDMQILKQMRLSVNEVKDYEWEYILSLAETKI